MRQKTCVPSNRMPASVPQRMRVRGCVLLAAMGAGLLVLFTDHARIVVAVIAIIAAVSGVLTEIENRRQARIAAERLDESICTFARLFNCRETDTWIIRAAHVELQQYVQFPIRPEDTLEEDLHIDSDDMPTRWKSSHNARVGRLKNASRIRCTAR